MSALPTQTFASPGNPLFYPVGQPIIVPEILTSSIVASTIVGQEIAIYPNSNTAWGVFGLNTSSISEIASAPITGNLLHSDFKENANQSTIQSYSQGFAANSSNYIMSYNINTPAGATSNIAKIELVSSIGPATGGGVAMTAQDNTLVVVGGQSLYTGVGNDYLLTTIIPPGSAALQYYDNSTYHSQVLFQSPSTIAIQSGNGAAEVNVSGAGISLVPGATSSVTLSNGSFNLNNLAMSNVSSINGALQPSVAYLDPYGPSPSFSTIGGSAVAVPMLYFSTIANHNYQVSVEYSATNGGGGGANDLTSIGITNYNSNLGLFGRFVAVDSWATLQSYDGRRANVTAIFPANSNSTGAAALELLDVATAGNIQVVTLEQVVVKDLGLPINNF